MTNPNGSPMSEQAQVGDTVRLTIEGKVYRSFGGYLMVDGTLLDHHNRSVEILSRAVPLLPSERGTWWLSPLGSMWLINMAGDFYCPAHPQWEPSDYAPFHQLVLK